MNLKIQIFVDFVGFVVFVPSRRARLSATSRRGLPHSMESPMLVERSYDAARIARGEDALGHVARDDAAGADDRAGADA